MKLLQIKEVEGLPSIITPQFTYSGEAQDYLRVVKLSQGIPVPSEINVQHATLGNNSFVNDKPAAHFIS